MRINPEKSLFTYSHIRELKQILTNDKHLSMRSPKNLKEVQQLEGWLTSLSRFMPKQAENTKPITQLMKKYAKIFVFT